MSSLPVSEPSIGSETRKEQSIALVAEIPEKAASVQYAQYLRVQKRRLWAVRLSQLLVLILFLGLWELAANMKWVDSMLTSKPSQIVHSFQELAFHGDLLKHTWTTAIETFIGIVVSMLFGTLVAVVFWWSTFASKVLEPYVVVLNALPKVALGPIFYIWLGDKYSIYGMAMAISVIVTIIMVESGFKEISKTKLKLMESFGASKAQMLRMVLLPASIPNLIATLKVNVGLTLVGVIMGEFLSSKAGLGYLIIYGGQVFQMNMVMVSIAMLALLSIVMYGLVNVIGRFAKKKYHFET
ncbi:ABC transporter permease [Paenibacillus sp. CGMCC 1.16610]|uniref:ABC transporter permease subunit n=1 Tax=Paenibacillus anseongense TaxID=2682845 RepID=A0ABW9U980_9BACL|nr:MULTISPECIES: ABC transporter permease [Paenibacillus]MBA2942539.1 ABC transporter permease [Paenibacillus sp. CGMCC 1.16610]MVQ35353.1 ABC transporter permease subunit [Paenibacillus anseongense]